MVFYLYGQPGGPEQSAFGIRIWKGHSDSRQMHKMKSSKSFGRKKE